MRTRKIIVVAVTLSAPLAMCAHAAPFDAKTEAKNAVAPVKSAAGTAGKLNSSYSQPITNSNVDMKSADGGTSFNGALLCPASTSFLELFTGVSTFGELTPLTISQDTDYNGSLDTTYNVPYSISGICANGIISCDPGTWDACKFYLWDADSTSHVTLNASTMDQLGGCYCINNHCGTGLAFSNLSTELSDLGGGIAAALSRVNPLAAITGVEASGPFMKYYGTHMGACGQPGTADQTAYYGDSASITTNAASTAAAAPTWSSTAYDASATYKLIKDSPAAQEAPTTTKVCNINRAVTLTHDYTAVPSCTPGTWFNDVRSGTFDADGVDGWAQWQVYCDPDAALRLRYRATDDEAGSSTGSCYTTYGADYFEYLTETFPTDTVVNQFRVERPGLAGSTCYDILVNINGYCGSSTGSCSFTFDWYNGKYPAYGAFVGWDLGFSSATCADRTAAGGAFKSGCIDFPSTAWGQSVGYWNHLQQSATFVRPHNDWVPDYSTCRVNTESIDDGCATIDTDPKCQIIEETVDGVTTIKNYNPTGLTPLPSSGVVSNNGCVLTLDREWWSKSRRYQCADSAAYNFDDLAKRVDHIQRTATATGYEDIQKDSTGTWSAPMPQTLAMPSMESMPTCIHACKTSRPKLSTEVGSAGVSADLKNSPTSIEHLYHECNDDVCPLGAGETIVKDCACIDTFADAAGMMQIIRLGAQSMICTSGTPLPPPTVPMP